MRRFIRQIGLYSAPIVLLAIALEFIGEAIPNSYSYKNEYMQHHAPQIKTLLLGSSYAYDGLNPSVLPLAFNLANSSQTIEDDYRLLAREIDRMDSLETVIVGVGYSSWAASTQDNRRLYYTLYMHLYPRWPLSRYSLEICNLELLTKKIIKYAVSRDVTRCDSLGQRLGHSAIDATRRTEFWNKDLQQMVNNDRLDIDASRELIETNIAYLRQMEALCKAHHVKLVIVGMPCQDAYREAMPAAQRALQDSVLRSFPDAVDATGWPIPEEGWYNATHLTREASESFSRQLWKVIYPNSEAL